jgi:16S rRNA (adenine1518-N6/adenine1519-N6)-dimethyltransferase
MHLKPKKRLGQNFLIDRNIQNKIIKACEFLAKDFVLEIGAGRGELTRLIADKVKHIQALEIDKALCDILKANTAGCKNLSIVNEDVLKFDLKKSFPQQKKIKVVGNIPYYITTPIIEYLLNYRDRIQYVFLTVQKEFARRMVAPPGSKEYGALTCFIKYYTNPEILFYISKNCFFPVPKVDSCFLRLSPRRVPIVRVKSRVLLFKIIRGAFNKRRKTLRNSLEFIVSKEKLQRFFTQYGIDNNIRPEELALEDFANLANS